MKKPLSFFLAAVVCLFTIGSDVNADSSDYKKLAAEKFKDIKSTDWYAERVGKLNQLQILDGYNGKFEPAALVTRAQFVKMLVQAMGYKRIDSISFEDIKPLEHGKAHWAAVYIETALRNGVISLDELGGKFYPEVPLIRKDMFMMMFKALKLQLSIGENPFFDVESNGAFTKLYEEYLVRGVLDGDKRLFMPSAHTTRAEAAVVISRMLEYKEDSVGFVARMATEDSYKELAARIKAGNYTEEDLIAKSKIELEKQKTDETYIPEPILKVEHVSDATLHVRMRLLNYRDYNSDFMIKMHCTNYPDINTIRTNSNIGLQTIAQNEWKEAQRAGRAVLFDIVEWNGKFTGKTCEYFQYNFKSGTVFNFIAAYKVDNTEKSFDYSVTIK